MQNLTETKEQHSQNLVVLDQWCLDILADPITKQKAKIDDFNFIDGVIDARIFLKNTHGFKGWKDGQDVFEISVTTNEYYRNEIEAYKKEIEYDKPIYEHFKLYGDILDVGGLAGTPREFLNEGQRYISIDPFITGLSQVPLAQKKAYSCFSKPLNFIGGVAEFLPFLKNSFDYVHMRSMLDHVQVPDLALKEANRVLKTGGKLIVGLYVEGGKTGNKSIKMYLKDIAKHSLEFFGVEKYKDFHVWHPTYQNLLKLITDNDFSVNESYWQPYWKDEVVYVLATKL
jgi:SAM-dependent methyltransferase